MEKRRSTCLVVIFSAIAFCLWLAPCAVGAQTLADFVAGSTSASNPVVLSILLGNDTTDALSAASALGKRSDPYVGDLLFALFGRTAGPDGYRVELLLRTILESVFLRPTPRTARITANAPELAGLLDGLQTIGDAATKMVLLEISQYLPVESSVKALVAEGAFLVAFMKQNPGRLPPDRAAEAVAYIEACRVHENGVLREQVTALVELAQDDSFVRAARAFLASSE